MASSIANHSPTTLGGIGEEEGRILLENHLAADARLLEYVHRLQRQRFLHAEAVDQGREFRRTRKRLEHRVEVVHGVSDLVDRLRLGLF